MFEQVNKAYEFISSKEARCVLSVASLPQFRSVLLCCCSSVDGPNPENIVLILRAQSILFKRFPDVLQPYKYAGYPMLMITVQVRERGCMPCLRGRVDA